MNKRRRGRPAGESSARADILAVARRRFLEEGYAAVSMRSVAGEAGVDPALISYHFGSKSGLFAACLDLAANPPQLLAAVLAGPAADLPERLLSTVVTVWDGPDTGATLRMLAVEAVRDAETGRLFREVLEREVFGRLADHFGGRDARQRAAAVASQLGGLIFLRYVIRAEPLVSMSRDELVRHLTPSLRAALAQPASRAIRAQSLGG